LAQLVAVALEDFYGGLKRSWTGGLADELAVGNARGEGYL
jgi:hypothetical protein